MIGFGSIQKHLTIDHKILKGEKFKGGKESDVSWEKGDNDARGEMAGLGTCPRP